MSWTITHEGRRWVVITEDDCCPECGGLASEFHKGIDKYDLYRCDDCQLRQAIRA